MKSFKGCSFKLHIPTCILFDNKAEFKIKFLFQGEERNDVILNKAVITDRFGDSKKAVLNMYFSTKKLTHSIRFLVVDKKKIYLTKSTLDLLFLQSNGYKIIVSYLFDSNQIASLENVEIKKMTDTEKQKFELIISNIIDTQDNPPINPPTDLYTDLKDSLEPYLDALIKEKKYLINEGGRKYKVTNGKYIGRVDNKYSYVFDLETELHIADDAPISLSVGMEKASGSVMMCEDFQIIIVIGMHMGQYISTAYLSVEPWKLLDSLADRVNYGLDNNAKLMNELYKGISFATTEPIENILKGQENAKKMSLKEPITIVWGPPGTGKTHTMAEVAISFFENNKTVLIVSHSNVSVDGIIKKIGDQLTNAHKMETLKSGLILRYGYVRDVQLRENHYLNSFAYAVSKDKANALKLEELQKEYEKSKAISGGVSQRELEIHKQIKDIRAVFRRKEEEYVKNARVVATTISKAIVDNTIMERLFDVVIFDEVSMANVLQIMSAASYAKEHLICVGDFMQLSPIVQSDAAKLEEDIFDYLRINDHGKPYFHPWMVMLDEQYRMHPAISGFSNKYVYKKLLRDHPSVLTEKNNIVKQEMFPDNPINFIDLYTTYCAATKNSDNSRFNILSGLLSFSIALKSEGNVKSVGIITPYAAQTRLIRALL